MKKITSKMWIYSINFLSKSILFNVALAFAIVSLVKVKEGFTNWALISTIIISMWLLQIIIGHIFWSIMTRGERSLWLAIRRHGKKIIEITDDEIQKHGQKDMLGILNDSDAGLEIKMIINGTGTLVNTFIGVKWLINARRFHNHKNEFNYHLTQK